MSSLIGYGFLLFVAGTILYTLTFPDLRSKEQ